ncbi:hypothetical protein MVEN_02554800 [Mycena venus]|uniref:Transmembrane protein n=1 Tax=Mycena venus TaxID=2733690 RepID=A0A8H6U423_9AGAR|nr:hypothetical protein MVEN_02554800 [Mycena venus]
MPSIHFDSHIPSLPAAHPSISSSSLSLPYPPSDAIRLPSAPGPCTNAFTVPLHLVFFFYFSFMLRCSETRSPCIARSQCIVIDGAPYLHRDLHRSLVPKGYSHSRVTSSMRSVLVVVLAVLPCLYLYPSLSGTWIWWQRQPRGRAYTLFSLFLHCLSFLLGSFLLRSHRTPMFMPGTLRDLMSFFSLFLFSRVSLCIVIDGPQLRR